MVERAPNSENNGQISNDTCPAQCKDHFQPSCLKLEPKGQEVWVRGPQHFQAGHGCWEPCSDLEGASGVYKGRDAASPALPRASHRDPGMHTCPTMAGCCRGPSAGGPEPSRPPGLSTPLQSSVRKHVRPHTEGSGTRGQCASQNTREPCGQEPLPHITGLIHR